MNKLNSPPENTLHIQTTQQPNMAKFHIFKRKKRAALPPSTTPQNNAANTAYKKKESGSGKKRFNRNTSPDGLEVQVKSPSLNLPQAGTAGSPTNDEVSVLTPMTGMPPDSPNRVQNLPSLLAAQPPPPSSRAPLGTAAYLYSSSIPTASSPSRGGGMNINVSDSVDDISVMTPTGITPDKKSKNAALQQRLVPPQILDFDIESDTEDLIVYEDEKSGESPPIILKPTISTPLFASSTTTTAKSSKKQPTPMSNTPKKLSRGRSSISYSAKKLLSQNKSWLTSTKYFNKAIDTSFDMIDVDKSGDVTLEELYAGLLLIHLKMAVYVGAPACRPASKQYVSEIFQLLDKDDSGTLTKEEFATVMKILYSQVFTRIVIQWTLTLMSKLLLIPSIAFFMLLYLIPDT